MGNDGCGGCRPHTGKPAERRKETKAATLEAFRRHPSLGLNRGGMGPQPRPSDFLNTCERRGCWAGRWNFLSARLAGYPIGESNDRGPTACQSDRTSCLPHPRVHRIVGPDESFGFASQQFALSLAAVPSRSAVALPCLANMIHERLMSDNGSVAAQSDAAMSASGR